MQRPSHVGVSSLDAKCPHGLQLAPEVPHGLQLAKKKTGREARSKGVCVPTWGA